MQTDNVMPSDKWSFDDDVTNVFDDMLKRSIPQYETMRSATFDLACEFVQHQTAVIDLGCSRGESLAPFVNKYGAQIKSIGIEVSKPMIEAARSRFDGYIKAGCVEICDMDLRRDFPSMNASVVLSILTLQFTPIEYRLKILERIYNGLMPNGAFLFVEKIIGGSAQIDDLMTKHYYKLKSSNGYSSEQIDRKRMALEGVLVPMTAQWNEEMLKLTGFKQVDCYWRWMNFAGWIAIK
jgi:tRNA (cmo5U34)-methyltransferase